MSALRRTRNRPHMPPAAGLRPEPGPLKDRRPGRPGRALVAQLDALYRVGELHGLAAAKVSPTQHGITWRELVGGTEAATKA